MSAKSGTVLRPDAGWPQHARSILVMTRLISVPALMVMVGRKLSEAATAARPFCPTACAPELSTAPAALPAPPAEAFPCCSAAPIIQSATVLKNQVGQWVTTLPGTPPAPATSTAAAPPRRITDPSGRVT